MLARSILAALGLGLALLAPSSSSLAASTPPRVTRVLVRKQAHTLTLFASDQALQTYKVAIGPGGAGPKLKEGDMVTPVGRYHVTMHQPSQYRIFLRLDYPTAADWRRFTSLKESGALPKDARIGGDIGIHGPPVSFPDDEKSRLKEHDWTAGCIAVNDDEIREIARLVPDGTVIDIED